MVEQRSLDDFNKGDWIGVHYQEPGKEFYCFPSVIEGISNRNPNPLEDFVLVSLSPKSCPRELTREYISRIWHTG
jgi:hypothetical protein